MSEFIILTGASYGLPADKKEKGVSISAISFPGGGGSVVNHTLAHTLLNNKKLLVTLNLHCTQATAVSSNFSTKDVHSASVSNVDKLSQSEYANLRPIEKTLKKLQLTCKNESHWREAHGGYCYLIKRDSNFKRRFPEKVYFLPFFPL